MSKGFRVLEKSKPPTPHSVLLEHRNKSETLLFESQAVAILCKFNFHLDIYFNLLSNMVSKTFQTNMEIINTLIFD